MILSSWQCTQVFSLSRFCGFQTIYSSAVEMFGKTNASKSPHLFCLSQEYLFLLNIVHEKPLSCICSGQRMEMKRTDMFDRWKFYISNLHFLHSTFSPSIFPVLFGGGPIGGSGTDWLMKIGRFTALRTRECAMERLFLLFYCKGGLRGFSKSCCKYSASQIQSFALNLKCEDGHED